METLSVGMFVRTKKDGIGRIISLSIGEEDECCFIELSNRRTGIKEHNISKASHNIIDLIEVGDYVDSYPVKSKFGSNAVCLDINYQKQGIDQIVKEKDIKSIVTKEQFESIKYSLEG